jgi:hypothetical protein
MDEVVEYLWSKSKALNTLLSTAHQSIFDYTEIKSWMCYFFLFQLTDFVFCLKSPFYLKILYI